MRTTPPLVSMKHLTDSGVFTLMMRTQVLHMGRMQPIKFGLRCLKDSPMSSGLPTILSTIQPRVGPLNSSTQFSVPMHPFPMPQLE